MPNTGRQPRAKRATSGASPAFQLDYTTPLTVVSETGVYSGVRYHRFQLAPGVQVNVHEDGRVRVDIPAYRLQLTYLINGAGGANATLKAEPIDGGQQDSAKVREEVARELLQQMQETLGLTSAEQQG